MIRHSCRIKLISPRILSFPQFTMEFTVDCDARLDGLGAVLSLKKMTGV